MASKKMTFTIPADIAAQLLRRVPARNRSSYVADAIASRLRAREERLIRSCDEANSSPDAHAVEQEWDALADPADRIEEPWTDAPPR